MSSQRYERVSATDNEPSISVSSHQRSAIIPSSPPPSFRSHESSPTRRYRLSEQDPLVSDADRTLADTFDSPSDEDSDDEESHVLDDRQRVMSGRPVSPTANSRGDDGNDGTTPAVERRVTQLPGFAPLASGPGVYGGGNSGHDGVFANLSAKPERGGEDAEEKPPSYETAAADATPPYWETTIMAPGGPHGSDSVFIDGLPVGSVFSFIWNGLISMSFQLVGFLLTYLLHTTHAAKNGSKAGLGITLIQYGFSLKAGGPGSPDSNAPPGALPTGIDVITPPDDPNAVDFDAASAATAAASAFAAADAGLGGAGGPGGLQLSDWLAYGLILAGWFVLIRAVSEYLKARRHEQLVLQSPSRGLDVPVVGEDEGPGTVV